jgi:hypothetical protein
MFSVNNNHDGESHECTSSIEGEWIVFRCPVCEDFERRIHLRTKKMKSKISPYNPYQHHGLYLRPGLNPDLYHPN